MDLREQLRGTGVALVTPFKLNLEIDFDALGKVIDFVISGGAEYVITLGTTGETPTLTKEEKIALIEFTYKHVDKRVAVVVGIGGNNTTSVLADLEQFPLEKATAILSAGPYYSRPSQEGLFQHYKAIASATVKPVILYNVPSRTGRNIASTTTIRLAKEVSNIAGIKEASGDMIQCMHILRDRPESFLVVSGDDTLALPQIACGMDGVISVAANSFPKQFSEMVRLALKSDFITAKELNDKLMDGYDFLFSENNPAGVKAALNELGLIENILRLPLTPLSKELDTKLRKYISQF
ncbi:MAG TPA: 4-hydroxy-tetrahydrodipicolinate synthase [Puia sp.]|nr:4-hydroxy-tetrahydrodipicolinate synthase [Puia sp.]